MSQAPGGQEPPDLPSTEPPADSPIVDLGAIAFVIGLLVLGVAMMLLMVRH